jgi:uncharacterized membrane protein YdjX (TVP38/TMEM64 family)
VKKLRPVALVLVIVLLIGVGIWLQRTGSLTQAALVEWVRGLGPWAVPAFILAFILGELIHLPGMLFVVAARVAFGPLVGFALGYGGAIIAVTAPFLLARTLGARRPRLGGARWRLIERLLDGVETHPLRTVVLLRLVLWLAPPVDYALAFTRIRTRDYVLGSAVGLIPIIALAAYGVSWFE